MTRQWIRCKKGIDDEGPRYRSGVSHFSGLRRRDKPGTKIEFRKLARKHIALPGRSDDVMHDVRGGRFSVRGL